MPMQFSRVPLLFSIAIACIAFTTLAWSFWLHYIHNPFVLNVFLCTEEKRVLMHGMGYVDVHGKENGLCHFDYTIDHGIFTRTYERTAIMKHACAVPANRFFVDMLKDAQWRPLFCTTETTPI